MQSANTSINAGELKQANLVLAFLAAIALSVVSTKAATQATEQEGKIGYSHVLLTDNKNTILGGDGNVASNLSDLGSGTIPSAQLDPRYMVVGGGHGNGVYSSVASTIAGGMHNVIQPWANFSVISGGVRNSISYASGYSTISGGIDNRIENGAYGAAINGGRDNIISGVLPDDIWGLDIASGSLVPGNLYRVTGSQGEYIIYQGIQIDAWHGGQGSPSGLFVASPGSPSYTENGDPSIEMLLSQLVLPDVPSGSLLAGHQYRVYGTSGTVTYNGVIYNILDYFTATSGVTTYQESNPSGTEVANADDKNHYGWIGGGIQNHVTGRWGSIGGGIGNVANGGATVPGGAWNHAEGFYSFAAGRHAHANHNGSFVWNDYQPDLDDDPERDVMSPADNTFNVRASGGIWLGGGSSIPSIPSGRFINTSTGGYLSTGGTWVNSSDKNAKENFSNVNTREILKGVSSLPIGKWNYKAENDMVQHIGPVAQDFYSAFSVGQDDRHIATIDADGVALASIQALNEILEEKDAKIRELEARLERLEASLIRQ